MTNTFTTICINYSTNVTVIDFRETKIHKNNEHLSRDVNKIMETEKEIDNQWMDSQDRNWTPMPVVRRSRSKQELMPRACRGSRRAGRHRDHVMSMTNAQFR